MSYVSALLPIIAALNIANNTFLDSLPNGWITKTTQQLNFITSYLTSYHELSAFSQKELVSCASRNYKDINAFLALHEIPLKVTPFSPRTSFGTASILDVKLTWPIKGLPEKKMIEQQEYNFVRFTEKQRRAHQVYEVYECIDYPHPVICLKASNDDLVYMTIATQPRKGDALHEQIKTMQNDLRMHSCPQQSSRIESIAFPMISLKKTDDLSWLLGIQKNGYAISQAVEHITFSMDENGAHVQAAAALVMTKSLIRNKKHIIIDKPFYLWIERPGVSTPLIAGYFDYDTWQRSS